MDAAAITFVVLTLNEGKRLDRALASLPAGAAILILDAYSTDDTLAVAERYGARVVQRAWTTFAAARIHAITLVDTAWLFMLDADEALTPQLRTSILAVAGDAHGYRCIRENRFCGKVMRGGAWGNESVLRYVRTDYASIESQASGELHEQLRVLGETPMLQGVIDHDSYPTISSYWKKFHRYTAIEAGGRSATLREIFTVAPVTCARALYQLTFRHGYRDGWRGFFVAGVSAAYPIVVRYRAWRRRPLSVAPGESAD